MAKDDSPPAKVFAVDVRFNKLAQRPGGMTRDEAITRAQTKVEEVKPQARQWLEGEIDNLVALLGALTRETSPSRHSIEEALSCSRRIRDVGTTIGYELLTFVAGNLCDILDAIVAGAEYRHAIVDCYVEAIQLAKQERYRNMRPEQVPELISGLRDMAARVNLSTTA